MFDNQKLFAIIKKKPNTDIFISSRNEKTNLKKIECLTQEIH